MIKDKFMLQYLEWDVFNKLKTLMLHWDWKHCYPLLPFFPVFVQKLFAQACMCFFANWNGGNG